jgi:trigger factor
MQVTETAAAGLKREYRVVVPATDLEAKVNERLDDLKGRVQLKGFRPGKVPVAHLKRLYGKSAMAEVIEAAVREANTKIVNDGGFKLATEPKVVLPTEEGAVEEVITGKSDLAYTVEMEIVPPITLADFKSLKLERQVAPVEDSEVDQALQTLADQNRPFGAKTDANAGAAEKGDRVIISFQGSLAGQPFEGGSGEDVPVVLGSGQFIPGFEDHLIGIKAGESRTFDVEFPDNYQSPALAGKEVTFAVTAKAVEAPSPVSVDDEFARR